MSFKSVVALFIMASILVCSPLLAQDSPQDPAQDAKSQDSSGEPTFKLLRDSALTASEADAEEEQEIWVPAIEAGSVEISFSLGLLDLKSTLLSQEAMIYKYTDEATYWGDITVEGDMAFNPTLSVGYNLNSWLSLEAVGGFSFSEYSSNAVNRKRRSNEENASPDFLEPALGEFDMEARSLLTANAGLNAVIYYLNMDGDGKGRIHPFVTGGVSNMWYSMNSNWVEGAATALDFNVGTGLRILADRNISIRMEVLYHVNSLEWTPAEYYTSRQEGTVNVPLDAFPSTSEGINQHNIESFDSNTISSLGFSLGVQGSF